MKKILSMVFLFTSLSLLAGGGQSKGSGSDNYVPLKTATPEKKPFDGKPWNRVTISDDMLVYASYEGEGVVRKWSLDGKNLLSETKVPMNCNSSYFGNGKWAYRKEKTLTVVTPQGDQSVEMRDTVKTYGFFDNDILLVVTDKGDVVRFDEKMEICGAPQNIKLDEVSGRIMGWQNGLAYTKDGESDEKGELHLVPSDSDEDRKKLLIRKELKKILRKPIAQKYLLGAHAHPYIEGRTQCVLYDINANKEHSSFEMRGEPVSLRTDSSTEKLAILSHKPQLQLFDLEAGKQLYSRNSDVWGYTSFHLDDKGVISVVGSLPSPRSVIYDTRDPAK